MRFIVRFFRAVFLLAWTGVATTIWLPLFIAFSLLSLVFPVFSKAAFKWRGICFGLWAKGVLKLLNVRIYQFGSLPARPFFVVSNHLSYLDIVVYASMFNSLFVAKQEVRSWPFIGWVARLLGTIFINRQKKSDVVTTGGKLIEAYEKGQSLLLFPEGTSTDGSDVVPFKPSLLEPFSQKAHPVHYARINYVTKREDPPASSHVCWWGDATFFPHVWSLMGLRRITASVHFGDEPCQDSDRKKLATQLHHNVKGLQS